MKRNVLILFADPSFEISEREWEPDYFSKILSKEDVNVIIALYRDVYFYLDDAGNQRFFVRNRELKLDETLAFVWFRTRGERSDMMYDMLPFMNGLAYLLKKKKIKFFDEELGDMLSINKFSDKIILSAENFQLPKTFLITNSATVDRDFVLSILHFPIVLKEKAYGSRGDGVSLLKTREAFDQYFEEENKFFILQEFIPNEVEYRYVISDYTLKRVEQRWHNEKEEFRNNSCLGAKEETIDLKEIDPFIRKESERSSRVFKRDLCGLDIIKHGDKYYFVEINHTPGFDNPETADPAYYQNVNVFSVNVVLDDIKQYIREHAKNSGLK
jgi:glutathione synthase/RimK-type ligase-like ATP-grasp enzyme